MNEYPAFNAKEFLNLVHDASTGGRCFITHQQVRFGHIDPAGIAYFPRIFNYIHEAFEDLWGNFIGLPYNRLVNDRRVGFPLVHADVDFKRGLHFGERPTVKVSCFKLGRASLGLRYRYEVGLNLCLEARMVTACIDLDSVASFPIPAEYRRAFVTIAEPTVSGP